MFVPVYNYARVNLWEKISLISVIWISSHALLQMYIGNPYPLISTVLGGWIILIIIGFFI